MPNTQIYIAVEMVHDYVLNKLIIYTDIDTRSSILTGYRFMYTRCLKTATLLFSFTNPRKLTNFNKTFRQYSRKMLVLRVIK